MLLTSLTSVTGLSTCIPNRNACRQIFHPVATLKCATQQKPKCMQRFRFSSLGRRFESVQLHTGAPHVWHANRSCFGAMDPKFGSVFVSSVAHRFAWLTSNQEMYCRWWTAWQEATSCCFVGLCCFGNRETFHLIVKN